ncbi:MAG: NUDIX domain-containing protein [archaeon]|nr:NUDIX domain-containing protein [archaeon]
MPKEFSHEEFKSIYSRVPRLTIDLLIKSKEGILFTKRAIEPFRGMWHLPGGGVLLNESLEEAGKRIAKRETGLNIEIKKFLGYIEFPHEKVLGFERHSVSLVFLAEPLSVEVKLNEESEDFNFRKDIPENTAPPHKEFLRKQKSLLKKI